MALWSTKRRLLYGGSVFIVFLVVIILLFFGLFYKTPTCNDGVKNGNETGIDCGGSCVNLCTTDTLTPVILWSKIFNISGDVYSAVAFVENPNVNSENQMATYKFKIYDANNTLIAVRDGVTSIPKNKRFAVFETGIILKNSVPKSADFQFVDFGPWQKNTVKDPEISLEYGTISSATTTPSFTGTIFNKSLQNILRVELVVLALDSNGNTIAAARTFVDNLLQNSSQNFVFTWQKPFTEDVSVINVVYRFVQN